MHIYDLIAFVLIGISHVLLYIQLIRYHRLSYTMMIVVSIVFMILVGIVVTVTGYLEFNFIILLLFFLFFCLIIVRLLFFIILFFYLFIIFFVFILIKLFNIVCI